MTKPQRVEFLCHCGCYVVFIGPLETALNWKKDGRCCGCKGIVKRVR